MTKTSEVEEAEGVAAVSVGTDVSEYTAEQRKQRLMRSEYAFFMIVSSFLVNLRGIKKPARGRQSRSFTSHEKMVRSI